MPGWYTPRRCRRERRPPITSFSYVRAEITKFKEKLDADESLEWLQTIECLFEYKDVRDDKIVKLVVLIL